MTQSVTPAVGGGQANATPITIGDDPFVLIGLPASNHDSVLMPSAIPGAEFSMWMPPAAPFSYNQVALFPSPGDKFLRSAVNAPAQLVAYSFARFVCFVAGTWIGIWANT